MLLGPILLLVAGTVLQTDCPPELRSDSWLCLVREVDLTADDAVDTVVVRATGRASDSLLITLTIRVNGQEAWREEWASSYELVDPPDFSSVSARDQYVRRSLQQTLESVSLAAFDRAGYEMMADAPDSVLLGEPPKYEIRFNYGYETTVVLMWDPASGSFRRLWTCC